MNPTLLTREKFVCAILTYIEPSYQLCLTHVNHDSSHSGNGYGFRFKDKREVIYKSITAHGVVPEIEDEIVPEDQRYGDKVDGQVGSHS